MDKPLIAYVPGVFAPQKCGVSHYTRLLRANLEAAGTSSAIFTVRDAAYQPLDEPVHVVAADWRMKSVLALAGTLRRASPALTHIQFAPGSFRFRRSILFLPLFLRAAGYRKPIITTLHEYGNWDWRPQQRVAAALFGKIERYGRRRDLWDAESGFLVTLSNSVIATNAHTLSALYSRLGDLHDRFVSIRLAPNIGVAACPRAVARNQLCNETGWPQQSFIIVYFGLIHPVKGLEILLKAFRECMRANSSARLLIAGGIQGLALSEQASAAYMEKLRRLALELGLGRNIVFTGYKPDETISRYLQAGDMGVLPFTYGVNLKSGSLLALLAHGVPTIVTGYEPPDETLERCGTVRIAPAKDVRGLLRQMKELMADSDARAWLARKARAFSAHHSWRTITTEHLRLYRTYGIGGS